MKKIKLCLVGADETDYEKSEGFGLNPKWDFKANPELECIIMDRKTMTAKPPKTGTYEMLTLKHRKTKVNYTVFSSKILDDRMKGYPLYSAIKIVFKGKPAGKEYYDYDVFFDRKFKYDPAVWESAEYNDSAQTTQTSQAAQVTQTNNSQIADDLPF